MHFIHSGVKYYKEFPSKGEISNEKKKEEIINSVQTIYSNNQKLTPLDLEMCLELIEGPIISQSIDYALEYNNLGQNKKYMKKTEKTEKRERNFFCCF